MEGRIEYWIEEQQQLGPGVRSLKPQECEVSSPRSAKSGACQCEISTAAAPAASTQQERRSALSIISSSSSSSKHVASASARVQRGLQHSPSSAQAQHTAVSTAAGIDRPQPSVYTQHTPQGQRGEPAMQCNRSAMYRAQAKSSPSTMPTAVKLSSLTRQQH